MAIDRKTAEAAKRRARELETVVRAGYDGRAVVVTTEHQAEHRNCVAIWNAFCAQEQARLDAAKRGTPAAALLAGKSVHREPCIDCGSDFHGTDSPSCRVANYDECED